MAYKLTFFVNGNETAFVTVHPSQKDRAELLLSRLCRYAARFNYNVQFQFEKIELS